MSFPIPERDLPECPKFLDQQAVRIIQTVLFLSLLLSSLRLIGYIVRFITESLQMDFAAFYTAGEALNAGLSPYRTHLQVDPPLWDGINEFLTSRFLYPPLVASLFRPLAILDYSAAKAVWTLAGLVALLLSLWLVNRTFQLHRTPLLVLAFGLLFTLYYPLLSYLERGQIDAFNLCLLTAAIFALLADTRGRSIAAGLLIVLATLFKLQCIYFVPFLLWRRRWWALLGYGIGGLCLLVLMIGMNGVASVRGYLLVEMPRISLYGDLGAADQFMDRADWRALHNGVPEGYTQKGGVSYLPEAFFFTKNTTTVRNLHSIAARFVPTISQTAVSLIAMGGFFVFLAVWEWLLLRRAGKERVAKDGHIRQQFFYWQLVLLVILLAGPMTWVMNLIWLLPLAWALLAELLRPLALHQQRYLALTLFAILLTALPDIHTFPLLFPVNPAWLRWQYVFATLLLFGALLLYWGTLVRESPVILSRMDLSDDQGDNRHV